MVEIDRNCSSCGTTVTVEVPDDLDRNSAVARLGIICSSCAERIREEEREADRAMREDEVRSRLKASGLPSTLSGLSFDDLRRDDENREAIELARRWATGEVTGAVLSGPVGVGKTFVAAVAVNDMARRRSVRWLSVARMLTQATAGFRHPSRDEITDVLTSPRLALVLDDIDKVSPTRYAQTVLFQAIDERVNEGTPLLITTNLSYHHLRENYGEAIASRVAGYCEAARIGGADRRGT